MSLFMLMLIPFRASGPPSEANVFLGPKATCLLQTAPWNSSGSQIQPERGKVCIQLWGEYSGLQNFQKGSYVSSGFP